MSFLSARPLGRAVVLLASFAHLACSPADSGPREPSNAGGAQTGGAPGVGGEATGGAPGTGGEVATGGSPTTGGVGGAPATGGAGTGGLGTGGEATGGTGGGGSGVVDCSTLPICDDFESDTPGSAPAGWTVRATQGGTLVVDDAQAHSGTRSVRVTNGLAFLVNTDVLPAPAGKLYVRSYMRWNEGVPKAHNSYISVAASATDEQDELRFGGQEEVLNFNAARGDGLAPNPYEYPSCQTCVAAPVGAWVCVEIMFDYANQVATAWLDDGVTPREFTVDDPSDFHSAGSQWPANVTALKIGHWAIGGAAQTIWYDDIKVGYERIGCE